VISACGDAEVAAETIEALEKVGAARLVVTGLDLVRRLGALAAAATGPVPVAHITCSPCVAAGLEAITPLSLAHAILDRDQAAPCGLQ
jgi:flagellar biosynthesis protein FlhF